MKHSPIPFSIYAGTIVGFGLLFLPTVVMAQSLFDISDLIIGWLDQLLPVLVLAIVMVIFWNMAQFVLKAGDELEREKYKKFIVWAIIALFIVTSIWGIVNFFIASIFPDAYFLEDPVYVDRYGNPV